MNAAGLFGEPMAAEQRFTPRDSDYRDAVGVKDGGRRQGAHDFEPLLIGHRILADEKFPRNRHLMLRQFNGSNKFILKNATHPIAARWNGDPFQQGGFGKSRHNK